MDLEPTAAIRWRGRSSFRAHRAPGVWLQRRLGASKAKDITVGGFQFKDFKVGVQLAQ